ncbi:hypothetical protein PG994_014530 [Apiospora phragmitis]|uniref:Transmembrane protein n=1 Tax=Apiospora phragmitis TaxID=2905665 RepID=A0ABR1T701_9PEZI
MNKPSTLTDWCQRFCADPSHLKRFKFRREMTGFKLDLVRRKMESLMRDVYYEGNLSVDLYPEDDRRDVYNNARANRWRMKGWVKFLFGISFLWIFSWPSLKLATHYFGAVTAKWPFSRVAANGRQREYVTVSEETLCNQWGPAIREAVLARRQVTLKQADMRRASQAPLEEKRVPWGGDRHD